MDVPPADPRLALLEASLERFRRQASLKFDLPLAEMDAAAVDLIGEAATLMDRHNNRVWELVRNPDLGLSDVYLPGPRRVVGPATNRGRPVPWHPGKD